MAAEVTREQKGGAAERPRYETPVFMPLGELAKGRGAACSVGVSVTGGGVGICRRGNVAHGLCALGPNV